MHLKAVGKKIVVKKDADEIMSDNPNVKKAIEEKKIIIPDIAEGLFNKTSAKGTIVSVGSEVRLPIKKGNRILFARFSFEKITEDGQYVVLDERDIHAIIEND